MLNNIFPYFSKLEPWQQHSIKKHAFLLCLIAGAILCYFCYVLQTDVDANHFKWKKHLNNDPKIVADLHLASPNATKSYAELMWKVFMI